MTTLTELRLNKGLSERQAAAAAKVARETYSRAERGESIHPSSAKKIADLFGKKVTDIWPVGGRAA